MPRRMWTALGRRRVRGIPLLAAGALALAGCASASPRVLHGPPHPRWDAPEMPDGGSSCLDGSMGAPGARASAAGPAPSGAAGDPILRVGGPPPTDVRGDACTCGCFPSFGSEPFGKNYAVVAADVLGFEFLLNQYDRHADSSDTYGSDGESIRRNLSGGWRLDKDPFATNQFAHPYGGSIYHGFARSAGLGYWESLGVDVAASALWEIAGERDPPSINDQITTPLAGSFLGEALFRTASLILESDGGRPRAATEVRAALVCPSAAFNRHAYGCRFDAVWPSCDPAVFWWWGVGARRNTGLTDVGVVSDLERDVAVAAFSVDYGLPGKCGYTYDRPFDYFHLEATATSSANAFPENLMVRGLLVGTDYWWGPSYRAIWGLYGSYDYFSPEVFRVSSTALSVGTTWQYLVTDRFALQGSLLGGVGFTAAGTTADARVDRDYRYSASPQVLVALRAVLGDVAMLDLTANDYFLADSLASSGASGSENVLRAQILLTVRVSGRHAIGLQFVESSRHPSLSDIFDSPQSVGALSLFYTYLSDVNFGVVLQ